MTKAFESELRPSPAEPVAISPARNGKSFFIETFGCQMNVHDSEKVAGVLLARGYRPAASIAEADLMLYNTCSIREKAAQKVFSRLGEWRYTIGSKVIGVIGCLAQQEGEEIFERAPWVSLVCGSASYRKLPELVDQLEAGGRRVMGLDLDTDETFETEVTRRDNPIRAYITIIEGCDYACSYCVVPHTRGPGAQPRERCGALRSAPPGGRGLHRNSIARPNGEFLSRSVAARAEFRRAACATSPPSREFAACGSPLRIPTISRARSSRRSTPRPRFAITFIFPVQSGSTRILRAMRRTYTRDEYLEKIAWIRAARRPISITSDIIVGFPGETEADFEESLSLLDAVGYDGVYAFTYSPRPNTTRRNNAGRHSRSGKVAPPRRSAGSPAPDSDRAQRKTHRQDFRSARGRAPRFPQPVGRPHHLQSSCKFHRNARESFRSIRFGENNARRTEQHFGRAVS